MMTLDLQELRAYDGLHGKGQLLISIKSALYDVTSGSDYYAPGASYHVFAGKEVARALALMSTREEDCRGDTGDLSERQRAVLVDWVRKFRGKYSVVGFLKEEAPPRGSPG